MSTQNNSAANFASFNNNNEENCMLAPKDLRNEEVQYAMVDFALPNNCNQAVDPKGWNKVADKQDRLMEFCKKNSIQLVPAPEQLVIVYRGKDAQIPSALTATMYNLANVGLGTEFISAKETTDKGIKKLSAFDKSLTLKGGTKIILSTYVADAHSKVEHVYADQFANWFMLFAAKQLAKLSTNQKVELLSIFNNIEVYEDGISFDITKDNGNGLYVNLETKVISARQERVANNAISVYNKEVSSDVAVIPLVQLIASNGFEGKTTNMVLNALPNMWQREPNYGVNLESDDPTRLLMDETYMPIEFATSDINGNSISVWPWVLPCNTSFDINILDDMLARGKALVVDKYAKQFVGSELAANAGLLGRQITETTDEFLTLHDADKEAKFFNRLTQARKHLKANVVGRSKSAFRVALPNGKTAAQSGVKLNTILSNSRLTSGSGPAFVNPNLTLDVSVKKTKTFRVTYDRLDAEVKNSLEMGKGKAHGIITLQQKLTEKISNVIANGKVFNYGDNVIALGGGKIVFLANRDLNQSYRVTKLVRMQSTTPSRPELVNYVADSFVVTVEVELSIKDAWFKLRNDGFKLTTLPYAVEYLQGDSIESATPYAQDWDILLNIETQKGKLCQVVTYILANGGGTYYPNEGTLVMDNGTIINLNNKDNEVYQWVVANTKTIYIQIAMAKAEYNMLMQYSNNNDDLFLVADNGDYVIIREKIQALLPEGGTYQHYEVEISTPRENTGKCGMTPEQLAAIGLQNNELAEALHEESRQYRAGVASLVAMANQKSVEESTPTINLSTNAGRELIAEVIGNLSGLSDAKIVDKYAKAFPTGVVFTTQSTYTENTTKLFVNFDVLRGMSVFIGGSAGDEISMEFVAFLNLLTNLPKTSVDGVVHSKLNLLKSRLNGWLIGAMESQGILKKAARSAEVCVTGKVRTMYSPILNHNEGELPKVALNPNCAIVTSLGVANGDLVAIGRTPMPMLTVCQVVLTTQVGIAHAGLLPHIWAASNEGDSDGRPVQ